MLLLSFLIHVFLYSIAPPQFWSSYLFGVLSLSSSHYYIFLCLSLQIIIFKLIIIISILGYLLILTIADKKCHKFVINAQHFFYLVEYKMYSVSYLRHNLLDLKI